jgi:hypothetical protein
MKKDFMNKFEEKKINNLKEIKGGTLSGPFGQSFSNFDMYQTFDATGDYSSPDIDDA